MKTIERIPTFEETATFRWSRFLLESMLAIGGALAITALIGSFHLYPLIPNISILYLLVILALASTFGRYAAVLASLSAFLAFDYFLVPPFYTFTIDRWEEWIALFIFLATALLTSQLTVVMRERTALARRREREATILYELIHLANSQERLEDQLKIVTESFVRVFASWGVQACALLLANEQGGPALSVETSLAGNGAALTPDERMQAVAVMKHGRMMEERTLPQPDHQDDAHRISQYSTIGPVTILRFIPLKTADRVLGVLCLRIQYPASWFSSIARMRQEQERSSSRIDFFWTFLDQATSILERAHLRLAVRSEHE